MDTATAPAPDLISASSSADEPAVVIDAPAAEAPRPTLTARLFGGTKLQATIDQLTADLGTARAELTAAQAQLAQAHADLADAREDIAAETAAREAAEAQAAAAQAELAALPDKVAAASLDAIASQGQAPADLPAASEDEGDGVYQTPEEVMDAMARERDPQKAADIYARHRAILFPSGKN